MPSGAGLVVKVFAYGSIAEKFDVELLCGQFLRLAGILRLK